ncbi:cell division protein FtsQ/DivIB [Nitrosospira sp. NRS527]|uniref:cell division protein FtsQ/DivIB n=1 Tax=Nitrosospira sp. NRS527 TaxID=155925 RepID=UPI001AF13177|nr:cell division protein FtsQ/DivIB [Nitrosospira sp. NRS527]BCT69088.1 Cell division protein FtsQ [Nitrosospira sp. NRS527]
MWDNHQALAALANWLFALAALIVVYLISQLTINSPLFPLKEVSLGGSGGRLKHVTREQVDGVVRSAVAGNFFTVDLEATRKAFVKLPWVRTASVRRIWPQGLEVTLEEHMAMARWNGGALVNLQGEIFNAASDEPLPEFEGPEESASEMARQYAAFKKMLQPLQQNIARMSLSDRRAWRISLENGTLLELGREQMGMRLERYVQVQDRSLVQLNQQLTYVDLRYPSGFAVR